jgi:hypothetical protein
LEQFASDGDAEVGHSLNANEDVEEFQWSKRLPIRNPQGNNLRFVDEIRVGIRRSKRSTRSRIQEHKNCFVNEVWSAYVTCNMILCIFPYSLHVDHVG